MQKQLLMLLLKTQPIQQLKKKHKFETNSLYKGSDFIIGAFFYSIHNVKNFICSF
jgi:hypothetical protein